MASSEQTGAPQGALARLRAARECLDAKDLKSAMAIYEEVLRDAGERADVLTTLSGDLGSTGHVGPLIELVAPRYDVKRHGPAVGFNLLQAYMAVRDPESAQHLLDLLFTLNRPDLEDRLLGFSNVISELLLEDATGMERMGSAEGVEAPPPDAPKVGVVTISKPLWFYGLEPLAGRILPAKSSKVRRVAFAQLSLPLERHDDEAGRDRIARSEVGFLATAIPAWMAEAFSFANAYAAYTAVAFVDHADGVRRPMVFQTDWTTDNLRNLVDTSNEGLDYVYTGSLKHKAGDYELVLKLWEVKKFRERKQFLARWTPSTAEAELGKLLDGLRQFMEWAPHAAGDGLPYQAPPSSRGWIDVMGASLALFLAEKGLTPKELVPALGGARGVIDAAHGSAVPSLAWLTLKARALQIGLPVPSDPTLAADPVVDAAKAQLESGGNA